MCGIAGSINYKNSVLALEKLVHRGPDSNGIWLDENIELIHLRLAIIDLTPLGHQPMIYSKWVITFNGEIYNYLEIKKDLENLGYKFNSTSDTEVILKSIDAWGIEKSLSKFNGMWAFALYNQETKKLILCRDRIGKKPLYYFCKNNKFIFASEIKAFPIFCFESYNNLSLVQYISNGYVPGEASYYNNIKKLLPGCYIEIDATNLKVEKMQYWQIPKPNTLQISFEEAIVETERLLTNAVKYRMIADVTVGAFLSGGIDSSLISVLAQKNTNKPIKTFSIGFHQKEYDESIYAKKIAKYIGSEHYEYKFSANDLLELLDDNKYYFDEPFGDSSSLPSMFLSKVTKKEVDVAVTLSGDGGDEMYLGYDRYFFTEKYYHLFKKIPKGIRPLASNLLKFTGNDKAIKMAYPLKNFSEENILSNMYFALKPWELDSVFTKDFLNQNFIKSDLDFYGLLNLSSNFFNEFKTISKVNQIDLCRNLPDDMLTKVDRAAMRYSLEVRSPLLDINLMNFAIPLMQEIKLTNGPKCILKNILNKHIPKELTERPKMGFAIPVRHWLKNELYPLVFEKINRLDGATFNKSNLLKILQEHKTGKRNYQSLLWNILMLKS